MTSSKNIIYFLVLAFCLFYHFLLAQKPSKTEIKALISKTLAALKNEDTVEFKKLFTDMPQNLDKAFLISQLDIIKPLLSPILTQKVSVYRIESNRVSEEIPEKEGAKNGPGVYQIDLLFKLSQHSFKGLSFRVKRDSNVWLYDGQHDFATLSGTHYLWCSRNKIICDTLIDRITGNKYFLDKDHIWITAINSERKLLWKVNPRTEFNLAPEMKNYRTDNPHIIYFSFNRMWADKTVCEIAVGYNNSQSWRLNQETGEYTFVGQD